MKYTRLQWQHAGYQIVRHRHVMLRSPLCRNGPNCTPNPPTCIGSGDTVSSSFGRRQALPFASTLSAPCNPRLLIFASALLLSRRHIPKSFGVKGQPCREMASSLACTASFWCGNNALKSLSVTYCAYAFPASALSMAVPLFPAPSISDHAEDKGSFPDSVWYAAFMRSSGVTASDGRVNAQTCAQQMTSVNAARYVPMVCLSFQK